MAGHLRMGVWSFRVPPSYAGSENSVSLIRSRNLGPENTAPTPGERPGSGSENKAPGRPGARGLAWLADAAVDGDPFTDPAAAAWAARDYKAYRYGTSKRAPATVNGALAAMSDLAIRRGLGKLDGDQVARVDSRPAKHPRHWSVATTCAGNGPPNPRRRGTVRSPQ